MPIAPGPVDVSALVKGNEIPKDFDRLLPQPTNPLFKAALVQTSVPSLENGGSDKLKNGHRFDSIPICNGFINAGMSCQPIFYVKEEHDTFFQVLEQFDCVVVRINPGQITAAGGDQAKFDEDMMKLYSKLPVWPTPDVMSKMGAKDALCKIKDMYFGLPDTVGYYEPADLETGFRKTIAFQPRVVKQNRGSAGEGIWIVKLASGKYCENYGDASASDDDMLELMEANDSHTEKHTVAEFIEWCVNGRTDKSGKWTSKGEGKYFAGGAAAGGQMVDQRYLPRIDEGESRFFMIGSELYGIEHYVYTGGVGGDTKTTVYPPTSKELGFDTNKQKLESETPAIMQALGLDMGQLPLLWAADFIPISDHHSEWVVGEFNCSCLGISGFLKTRGKTLAAASKEDYAAGQAMCDFIGKKALVILAQPRVEGVSAANGCGCSVM